MSNFEIAAFYKFRPVNDPASLRERLALACRNAGARGILLIAPEGINGTIATAAGKLAPLLEAIRKESGFDDIEPRLSFDSEMPFLRMKVRLKKEIVTIGDDAVDPNETVGTYVAPEDWNKLIAEPDVLLLDTRNDYEVRIGTFKGALDPKTHSFSEFPSFVRQTLDPKKHKRIAMFCTGGIRCEKASHVMLKEGFEEVYHLKGGILAYLEKIPPSESQWEGGCFVFDRRVALGHGLKPEPIDLCFNCLAPLTPEDRQSKDFEEGVSCPHCAPLLTPARRAAVRERHRQTLLAEARGTHHLGPPEKTEAA